MSGEIAWSAFKAWFRVRGGLAGPVVFLAIMFCVEGAFWRTVSAGAAVGGYSGPRLLIYIFSALTVSQICACSGDPDSLSRRVETGSLDSFLLRPASYVGQMLAVQSGQTLARAAALWPLLPLSEFLLTGSVHWRSQLAALALLPGASAVNFLINHILGTLAFHFRDSYAFVTFKETLCWVLNGTLIPLDLLPGMLATAAAVAPPAFIAYYPAKVAMGEAAFSTAFAGQLAYLVALGVIAGGAWNAGIRRYQAYGG